MNSRQQNIEDAKLADNDNCFKLPIEESMDEADENIDSSMTQSGTYTSLLRKYAECHETSSKLADNNDCFKLPIEESMDEEDENIDSSMTQSVPYTSLLRKYAECHEASSSKSILTQEDFDPHHSRELSFLCPVCSVGIETKEELKIHIINVHNSSRECADNILRALGIDVSSTSNPTKRKKQDTPDDVLSTCENTSASHSRAFMERPKTFISDIHSINETVSSVEMFDNTNTSPIAQMSGCSTESGFTKSSNEMFQGLVASGDTQEQNRFNEGLSNIEISSQNSQYVSIINKTCKKCGKICTSVQSLMQHEIQEHAYSPIDYSETESSFEKIAHKYITSINKPAQSNISNMALPMRSPLPIDMNMISSPLNMCYPQLLNPMLNPSAYWPIQNFTYPYWLNPNMNNEHSAIPTNSPAPQRRPKTVNNKSPSEHWLSETTPNSQDVTSQGVSQSNKRAMKMQEGCNKETSAHANKGNVLDEYPKNTMNKNSEQERQNQNQPSGANSNNFPTRANSTVSEENVRQFTDRHSISEENAPRNLYIFDPEKFENEYRKTLENEACKELNKPFKNSVPSSMSQTFAKSDSQSSQTLGATSGGYTWSPNAQSHSQLPVTDSTSELYNSSKNTNNNQSGIFDFLNSPPVNFTKWANSRSEEVFYNDTESELNKETSLSKNFVQRLLKKDHQKLKKKFQERDATIDTLREKVFGCIACPETFQEHTQLIRHRQFSCLETHNRFDVISDDEQSPEASKAEVQQPPGLVISKGVGIDAFYNNREELYTCDICSLTFFGNALWAQHQKAHASNPTERLSS